MDPLVKLAESSAALVSPRRYVVRGAVAGGILYAGFGALLELGELGTAGFSIFQLLIGLGFGLTAGALMGGAFSTVLRRFSRPTFLAHVTAGLVSATVLIVPFTILVHTILPINPILAGAAGVLGFGASLGALIWGYRARAA